MNLWSRNEWDPLRKVVVGTADGFVPGLEFDTHVPDKIADQAAAVARAALPQTYLDEVNEDLDRLCDVLKGFNIEVFRPDWPSPSSRFSTPEWQAEGFDLYNVRDLHILFGDTLVSSAPASRFRLFERYALQEIIYKHFFDEGIRWITAPTPRLQGDYLYELNGPRNELEASEEQLHAELSGGLKETYHRLLENEVIFDAANIIRLGDEAIFLVSNTGNKKAAKWIESAVPSVKFHVTEAYRSSHLDSTILPLRDGLVLLNGARVSEQNLPTCLNRWKTLYFNDPSPVPEGEIKFHEKYRLPAYRRLKELGAESTLGHMSSPWAGLNVLSVDGNTVLVHDQQIKLISMLEKEGLTVVPVQLRHSYTMLGGLHCSTLDVVRDNSQ